jgi:hypothetical protein
MKSLIITCLAMLIAFGTSAFAETPKKADCHCHCKDHAKSEINDKT